MIQARQSKRTLFLLLTALFLFNSACKRDQSLDQILFKASRNKIYKEIDEKKLASILENTIVEEAKNLRNPKFISNFYKKNGFHAVLIKRYLPNNQLRHLSRYLMEVEEHGLSPEVFAADTYRQQLEKVLNQESIKTLNDAYKVLAQLEIQSAHNLLNYSNALSYGLVNPTKIFKRYYMETKRPDSISMTKALIAKDLKIYLDSIQPASKNYKILQKALISSIVAPEKSEEETKKIIQVNLERLRWKHHYDPDNMVYVNIPAFKLKLIRSGRPVDEMKVVIGTGRNNAGKDNIGKLLTPVTDAPHSHETPVLSSLIHSVQVNPVWNIPESIASKEILNLIKNDRFYLANNGIEVLENGNVIEDPEYIDWTSISKENLPYRFRQKPGEDNALGKIKFLFKNNSSVYLHDTPTQAAFERDIRASSHGCVRVEKPLDLANFLFGNSEKFKIIKNEMESASPHAKDITLDSQTTVVLDYNTLVVNQGQIQFFPDIYGLDIVLYSHLERF